MVKQRNLLVGRALSTLDLLSAFYYRFFKNKTDLIPEEDARNLVAMFFYEIVKHVVQTKGEFHFNRKGHIIKLETITGDAYKDLRDLGVQKHRDPVKDNFKMYRVHMEVPQTLGMNVATKTELLDLAYNPTIPSEKKILYTQDILDRTYNYFENYSVAQIDLLIKTFLRGFLQQFRKTATFISSSPGYHVVGCEKQFKIYIHNPRTSADYFANRVKFLYTNYDFVTRGYYFFCLSDEELIALVQFKNTLGTKKRNNPFKRCYMRDLTVYNIFELCIRKASVKNKPHIFRIKTRGMADFDVEKTYRKIFLKRSQYMYYLTDEGLIPTCKEFYFKPFNSLFKSREAQRTKYKIVYDREHKYLHGWNGARHSPPNSTKKQPI